MLSFSRSALVLSCGTFATLMAIPAFAQTIITTSSSVRLRAEATTASKVLAELPLGTELTVCGPLVDGWREVETPAGGHGWIHASLTTDLPPPGRLDVVERIIRTRLARTTESLRGRMELTALVERQQREPAGYDDAARLELWKFRAVAAVLDALPFGSEPAEAYRDWLESHRSVIAYHDSFGRYILRPETLFRAHARYQRAPAGEDLLWLAVTNGFPGECEGLLRCYIGRVDAAEGEYLRWYPEGRYVEPAMRRLQERAAWWKARTDERYGFSPAAECGEIAPMLENLKFAVGTASHADRNRTIALLDDAGWRCR